MTTLNIPSVGKSISRDGRNGRIQAYGFGFFAPLLLTVGTLMAQQPPQQPTIPTTPSPTTRAEASLRPSYVLGTNDQILIRATGVTEFASTPYRVEENGEIGLPLIGRVRAAGLSVEELEQDLTKRLREFIVNPLVSITIVQFRSEPVFAVGAFQRPGIHPLQGRRTLLDTLIALGGLQPNASRRIKVTRRLENGTIPLPTAVENRVEGISSVEINLNRLSETVNPAEDIVLEPYDVISAQKTDMVYVNGEVTRPGPFEVIDGESASIIQLVTLAGGLTPDANAKETKVLRLLTGTSRRGEIQVNLEDVLAGRENDFPLLPNDVLFVPKSKSFAASLGRMLVLTVPAMATALIVTLIR